MGKKITAFIRRASLLAVCMIFFACNALVVFAQDEQLYGGVSAAEWQEYTKALFSASFLDATQEEMEATMEYCRQSGMQSVVAMYEYWFAKSPSLGGFIEYGDFSINDDNGITHALQIVIFENGKIEFEIVEDSMLEVRDFYMRDYVEVKPDMGQVMSKAGMNTLMGVGTVFVVLALMIILISLFKYVNVIELKGKDIRLEGRL